MADVAIRTLPPVPAADWLRAIPPAMRFVLHGVAFSEDACRALVQDMRATVWLGPDEYLLLGADEHAQDPTAQALERALGDIPHALVNIGHRQFALEVSGPHAAAILNGGCPLDLDLVEFPVGMCTRTVFSKADIVLWRTAENSFHLEVWRSFGGYVTGLLAEIAVEFYGRGGTV
jgi:sarcosine oxidase subunit gamma